MTTVAGVRTTVGGALAALALATGCGGAAGAGDDTTIRVFAAASLTEALTEVADRFEAAHDGVRVELSFGPSSGLAEQIAAGAPADVFASASTSTMDIVVAAGDAEHPQPFARNRMQVAVPPDNPAGITRLEDLSRPGTKVATCQRQVPCGEAAADVFTRSGVDVDPVTEESDVKAVLTKVTLGEVDAGLVYATDVRAAGDAVRGIALPEDQNASTTCPIAALAGSEHPEEAAELVDYVRSRPALEVLEDAGFERP